MTRTPRAIPPEHSLVLSVVFFLLGVLTLMWAVS